MSWRSRFMIGLSLLLLIVFVLAHVSRWDILTFATVFPMFVWLALGLFVSVFVFDARRWRYGLLLAWLLAAFVLGDSPQNLLRTFVPRDLGWESARGNGTAFRIVSLNCQSSLAAIESLTALDADVILTQESPSSQNYQQLAERAFPGYTLVWSVDAAMLVRGSANMVPVPNQLTGNYVLAEVTLNNGAKFNIASTRLIPVPLRFDVWSPAAWESYSSNRDQRRQQLKNIFSELQPLLQNSNTPLILGGDFNAAAGDAVFEVLQPGLRDAWREAGRGWGKTIVNDLPVQRIDAVWISDQFRAESVTSQRSSSDHQTVICDLWLEPLTPQPE